MDRYVARQGFPLGTDEEQAIAAAVATAEEGQRAQGRTPRGEPNARVLRTPETEANGEFLVRVDGELA